MKKSFLALILSAVMMLTSVSPALAAEFSSGEEDALVSIQMQADDTADVQDESSDETEVQERDAVFAEETVTEDLRTADLAGEAQVTEEFQDTEEILTDGEAEDVFEDGFLEEHTFEETADQPENEKSETVSKDLSYGDGLPGITYDLYSGSPEDLVRTDSDGLFTSGSGELTAEQEADVETILNAGETLKDNMVKRNTSVTISMTLNSVLDPEDLADMVVQIALYDTGVSYEGDYLRWHVLESRYTSSQNGLDYNIVYTFGYSDTYAQEQKAGQAIDAALDSMNFSTATTPYVRIKTIYDYVCRNVTYDYEHLYEESYYLKFSAYAAAINKTAVCQGYALLLYRMLQEAGIDNRMIPSAGHIWNIVYLRGNYYNVDATWDSDNTASGYEYFLKGSESFRKDVDHVREANSVYTTAEFMTLYPVPSTDYVVQAGDNPSGGVCAHTWGDWEVLLEADCTEEGLKGRVCSKCGEEEYAEIAKTAHKWEYTSNHNNKHTAVCTVCGKTKTVKCTFSNNICKKCKGQFIPGAAKISKVKSAGYNKLKITWAEVSGAAGYEVYYLKGSTWKKIATTTETSYTHTGSETYPVTTGTTYYYRVRAYCKVNDNYTYGAYSAKAGGKPVAARPALVSVTAKAYNKVTIKWKKAAGATHYLIYRKNGNKWERIAKLEGANITSYTHVSSAKHPIVAGTEYVYSVRSYTKTQTGSTLGLYNKTGKTVTTSLGVPSPTVSKKKAGLKISWKKVRGATGYQIQRYSDGKWTVIKKVKAGTLSYTDKTVEKGASYQYRVRAYRKYSTGRVYGSYSDVKTCNYS